MQRQSGVECAIILNNTNTNQRRPIHFAEIHVLGVILYLYCHIICMTLKLIIFQCTTFSFFYFNIIIFGFFHSSKLWDILNKELIFYIQQLRCLKKISVKSKITNPSRMCSKHIISHFRLEIQSFLYINVTFKDNFIH